MTRIKSDNVQLTGAFVVPIEQSHQTAKIKEALSKEQQIIQQGEQKAQEIIAQAQAQAQQLLEATQTQAEQELEAILDQARKEGFEAGREEGLTSIKNELEEKIVAVNNFAQGAYDIKKNIVKSAHLDIIRLIVEISEKVCSKALELDEDVLKEITITAIQSLKDKESITIIVNPLMAEQIYSISEDLKERIMQLSSIKIIEDASVSPDGTIVESPLSRVDSRVKSQINEISEKLMAKLNSTSNEDLLEEVDTDEAVDGKREL